MSRHHADLLAIAYMNGFPGLAVMSLDEFMLTYGGTMLEEERNAGYAILHLFVEHGGPVK